MKNTRGFLLAEETLKIVIAVISITFLVYFLVSLYMSNKDSQDLELAKASLEYLVEEIDSGRTEVEIYNPEGWVIVSWPHNVLKGSLFFRKDVSDIPNSCLNLDWKSCICICQDTLLLNLEGEDCDKMGTCFESEIIVENDVLEIKNSPLKLNIEYGEEIVIK